MRSVVSGGKSACQRGQKLVESGRSGELREDLFGGEEVRMQQNWCLMESGEALVRDGT